MSRPKNKSGYYDPLDNKPQKKSGRMLRVFRGSESKVESRRSINEFCKQRGITRKEFQKLKIKMKRVEAELAAMDERTMASKRATRQHLK